MRGDQRPLPRLVIPVSDYLSAIELQITSIVRGHVLPRLAEERLIDIASELRQRAWKIRERDLQLLKKGNHPCQTAKRF